MTLSDPNFVDQSAIFFLTPTLVGIPWNFFLTLTTNLEYQIKSNYKTTSTTPRENRETNL